MNTRDLAVVGALGVGAYLLLRKKHASADGASSVVQAAYTPDGAAVAAEDPPNCIRFRHLTTRDCSDQRGEWRAADGTCLVCTALAYEGFGDTPVAISPLVLALGALGAAWFLVRRS